MPASCRRRTACAAISGVSSAGLASTGLPAASAAATWPVKIASGKFHGLMQTTGPSGRCVALSKPSRDLGGVVAQEVDRLAHLGDGVGQRLAGLAHDQAEQGAACALPSGRRRAAGRRRARPAASRPRRRGGGGLGEGRVHRLGRRLDDAGRRCRGGRRGCAPRAPRRSPPRRRPAAARRVSGGVAAGEQGARRARRGAARSSGRGRRSSAARRRTGRAAGRSAGAGRRRARWPAPPRPGRRSAPRSGPRASAMRLTKEELAPFSSRRRTR